jgi:micrococcal nuclease
VSREALFVVVMAAFLCIPALACGLSMGVGTAPSPPTIPGLRATGSVTALVTSTVDGDTVHVRVQGHDDKVRFIGVDTPEVDWYGQGECYGATAGRYTRQRLEGKIVRLDFDVRLRDVYGRLLAYVYVGGELFNRTLVLRGSATSEPVPPDTRMASTFAAAEKVARAAKRGLWSACPGR